MIAFGALALLSQTAEPISAQTEPLDVLTTLNPDGALDLSAGVNAALNSTKGPVLSGRANAAPKQVNAWSSLPHGGLNGPVFAIAAMGEDVYVGGRFTATADGQVQNLNRIAKYSNGAWSSLPNDGLDGGVVRALLVIGDNLVVGGSFSKTADGRVEDLNNIARLSDGEWQPMPNKGLMGISVLALELHENDLYVGGHFAYTGDYTVKGLNNIAKLSLGEWSAMPQNGLNHEVNALKWFKNDLYVGGSFTGTEAKSEFRMEHFAILKGGNQWQNIAGNGLDQTVKALEVYKNRLVVGGNFMQSADGSQKNLSHIIFFDGKTFGEFTGQGLNNRVEALLIKEGVLYVGGAFNRTNDSVRSNLIGVAKFANDT